MTDDQLLRSFLTPNASSLLSLESVRSLFHCSFPVARCVLLALAFLVLVPFVVACGSSSDLPTYSENDKILFSENLDSGEEESEEDDKEGDAEDLAEADEDESDLDLAWKMLDIARAILDKHSVETVEKVDVLSALAEVALEREDIETSLSDYKNALSILEKLVEQDSRQIAELNFRICLCLEIGSKPEEAIPYCEKAISICKFRVQRLTHEIRTCCKPPSDVDADKSSSGSRYCLTLADKESEIKTLEGLSVELEKKLEDLRQLAANPTSILSEILGIASTKAKEMEKRASSSSAGVSSSRVASCNNSEGFDSPTVSTAHTIGVSSGVTDLGVVGRGVKRVSMSSAVQPSPTKKKSQLGFHAEKKDGNAS